MSLRCMVGLHDWRGYRSGFVGEPDHTLVIRSWCPRCKADSILFGTYREVYRNAWAGTTPAEQDAEFQALRDWAAPPVKEGPA
jgi:hypothetical protein